MARLTSPKMRAILEIGVLLAHLFGKGNRAIRIATILNAVPGQADAFKRARTKIDEAADRAETDATPAETYTIVLTQEELLALDKAHDLLAKTGRQLRRSIRRLRD